MARSNGCPKRFGSSRWKAPRATVGGLTKAPDPFCPLTPFALGPLLPWELLATCPHDEKRRGHQCRTGGRRPDLRVLEWRCD